MNASDNHRRGVPALTLALLIFATVLWLAVALFTGAGMFAWLAAGAFGLTAVAALIGRHR